MIGLSCQGACLRAAVPEIILSEAHCQANRGINAVGLSNFISHLSFFSFGFSRTFFVCFFGEGTKEKLEEYNTKVVRLNKDILKAEMWNAQNIKKRAARLSKEVFKLFPIEKPEESISFVDPRYVSYTCADSSNATSKIVSYYELLGERVNVDSFATMLRSVVRKLYDLDSEIIESLARNNHLFSGSYYPFFSYDKSKAHNPVKIPDTEIYMSSGFSAAHIIRIIKQLINAHGLDIESDFVYVARSVTNK